MADFYELPTDGQEIQEALGWLLQRYPNVKIWVGLESEDGAELLLSATPSKKEEVVNKLKCYDDEIDFFEARVVMAG